ncbi:MAG: acyl-CoA/acyl-ACP dehydrogenase [Reyranella sp.]|nr:acyl-CoA/acyl-ACP dehydrogenase [Reyranella sp.]
MRESKAIGSLAIGVRQVDRDVRLEHESSIGIDGRHDVVDRLRVEFAATAEHYDRTASFPFENFHRLSEAGLLALTVPRKFGGAGAGLADAIAVVGGIARGEPSTALVLAMQYAMHASIPARAWPSHIVERLAREAAAGVSLVNALRVEPELGTPARGGLPATVALCNEFGWRLRGHKIYSTGIPILSWLAVWARTDEEEPRVGTFLVPAKAAGVRIVETWDHLGMRATGSHDVILEDVEIPADHAVDIRPPKAWTSPDAVQVAWGALLVAAVYDGIARSARDWLVDFLRDRKPANLGASLATLPRMQEAVGEIETLLAANARLLRSAALDLDDGRPPAPSEAGMLKSIITNNAIAAVEGALKLTGNHGVSRRNALERHHRDVVCARIHTPQDDSVRLAAGRLALQI